MFIKGVAIIISSMYTRQLVHCNTARTEFISLWKVAGALHKPKGITLNSNELETFPFMVVDTI